MPWVSGEGSILKPVDTVTKIFQKLDFTSVTKHTINLTKNIVDTFTSIFTGKKLKQVLTGFEIPLFLSKELGGLIYSFYIIPLFAIFSSFMTVLANKRKKWDIVLGITSFLLFFALFLQVEVFNQEKFFLSVKEEWGFRGTLYLLALFGVLSILKFFIKDKREI